MGFQRVSVTKGVSPFVKYEKLRTIAADDLTAVSIVRLRDRKEMDDREFAMKFLTLRGDAEETEIALEELRNEIETYCSLEPHPNIVRVYDVFEYQINLYVIMELCTGGNIIGRALREGSIIGRSLRQGSSVLAAQPQSEHKAAKVIGKLLSGVRYLHDHHIIHGDLRPENICYERMDDPDAEIKIMDFGMSRRDTDKSRGEYQNYIKNFAAAPETYQGFYLPPSDMWSVGVITFMLLSGKFPFTNDQHGTAHEHVKKGEFDPFGGEIWNYVSPEAKDFIAKLLVVEPTQRLSAREAQEHVWLKHEFNSNDRAPSQMLLDQVHHDLQVSTRMSRFHRIVMNTVAHLLSNQDLLELRSAFDAFDSNNSGMISFKEFKEVMRQKTNVPSNELGIMFSGAEIDLDGELSYLEFLAATLEFHAKIAETTLVEAFHRLDTTNKGYVSPKDILKIHPTSQQDAENILKEVGVEDGRVSCEDFLRVFRKESNRLRAEALDPVPIGSRRADDL